ncbi:hypothetical protein BJ508DRAFT_326746 [Ascobolus immersus RN42]|uniref:Uncharacterized protein n=1 Tax=Ascobolus immersus RN42 TaxID=1160509 RepID=A0A3N4I4W0_ASCIM|nr:hypothetical protein BJ508DRAFT_326746 [Ascobolus immersus RN42]
MKFTTVTLLALTLTTASAAVLPINKRAIGEVRRCHTGCTEQPLIHLPSVSSENEEEDQEDPFADFKKSLALAREQERKCCTTFPETYPVENRLMGEGAAVPVPVQEVDEEGEVVDEEQRGAAEEIFSATRGKVGGAGEENGQDGGSGGRSSGVE